MARLLKRFLASGLVIGLSTTLTLNIGCFPQQTKRAQLPDDPDKDLFATIGSKTSVGNAEPISVSGVGLVYNLSGTGSIPAADGWRTMLETSLKKNKMTNVRDVIEDPGRTTSLVLVTASIPPGSRHGDRLDAEITLPPGSKTTSLKQGILYDTQLTNYELAGQLRKNLNEQGVPVGKVPQASSESLVIGSKLATAHGQLVTGVLVDEKAQRRQQSSDDEETITPTGPIVAKIWGGTTCLYDRPYYFILNDTAPQPKLAMVIASRLNSVFHGSGDRSGKVAEAKVQGKPLVAAFVPPSYRLNHTRFLMVARQVPLVPYTARDGQRKKLEEELLLPETTITAALKLEALGAEGEDALRVGLEEESPWVKFAAATSLCYLGKADPRTAQILSELATRHVALRSHCLMALASQDDAPCIDQLVDLMKKGDPTLRYGAFVALRTADENHDAIRGRKMGQSFTLHMVARESEPLIHLTTDRRNEIVLYGKTWPISGEFSFPMGNEFTASKKAGDDTITVSRVVKRKLKQTTDDDPLEVIQEKFPNDLSKVLKGIVEMGGTYADAIELVRRLNVAESLSCPIAVDALPRGLNIQSLAVIARTDPTLSKANAQVTKVLQGGDPADNWEIPDEADAVRRTPVNNEPALNRNPGSLLNSIPGRTPNSGIGSIRN